jgi:signal peptidase II
VSTQTAAAPPRTGGRAAQWIILGVAAAAVIIDQITKAWAVAELQGEAARPLIGEFLQLTFVRNPGAAFSFGQGQTWLFTLIGAVVIGAILWFTPKVRNRWWGLSLGLLLGGAIGNFIDRWVQPPAAGQGHVVDFLELPNWPVFNVADICVVAGAVLMIVLSLWGVDHRQPGWGKGEGGPSDAPAAPVDQTLSSAAETAAGEAPQAIERD